MKFSDMISIAEEQITENKMFADFEVNKLCYNSRAVEKNDIFFAVKGFKTDGNEYIPDAIDKGAGAVITDSLNTSEHYNIFKVNDCRKTMAIMANHYYGYPSQKMKMIGVTGTNGKTTITNIIEHVLSIYGKNIGLIGTNGNYIKGKKFETEHTTPESIELNSLLNEMSNEDVEYVVMEVSSHSLALKRVLGIEFDITVFTNLTSEHMDFHTDMENYFSTKKLLFDSTKRINKKGNHTYAVYNSDDAYGHRMISTTESERVSYGFHRSMYSVSDLKMSFEGMRFNILVPVNGIEKMDLNTSLIGKFNVYNILAAIAVLRTQNIPYDIIKEGISSFKAVDGRFNPVYLKNGAIGIIDYSHTPDSLQKAINTIREINLASAKGGKVITVFGCGGDRDKNKRPEMGRIASELSSDVIITSDNPRSEEPMNIIKDILKGVSGDNYIIEEERSKAIDIAYSISTKNDVILIAGKGHETYQEIKGVRYHLSDRELISNYEK
jgi:UDP-N-acetylmuramoyl-L-alanyl-D-glutamate--2,6-diaminopimelate ligase